MVIEVHILDLNQKWDPPLTIQVEVYRVRVDSPTPLCVHEQITHQNEYCTFH